MYEAQRSKLQVSRKVAEEHIWVPLEGKGLPDVSRGVLFLPPALQNKRAGVSVLCNLS